MRFSFFVSACILLVSCLLTSALASTSFLLSNNIQVNQRNLTLYQQQDQKLYPLNTVTTDEPNTSPTLKRRLALVDSSSTTSSKDPIFALVIFVALSSLMF